MEVRCTDHAADEVLATTAAPELAPGEAQVPSQAVQEPEASGVDEHAQHAPAEINDDALVNSDTRPFTDNKKMRSCRISRKINKRILSTTTQLLSPTQTSS
eukprot:SAG11_NODE_22690_length_401_cov_2.195364_1_plen_101_part_00